MLKPLVAYAATAVAFLALDAAWLTFAIPRVYRPELGVLLADKVRLAPGVVFYLLYVAGVVYFAVAPAVVEGSWSRAAVSGALLGLVAYGAYDLTSQATLRHWSTKVTVIDMGWGTFATAIAATLGFFAARALAR